MGIYSEYFDLPLEAKDLSYLDSCIDCDYPCDLTGKCKEDK